MVIMRNRPDRCPGALRPWPAADGLLVRLRLIGGRIDSEQLRSVLAVAERFGDGYLHLTSRANLQLRGLPGDEDRLEGEALVALESTGLLPTRSHERVRNVMISPQSGLAGGRADLRHLGRNLDLLLCSRRRLADLPGRFLFVLDDGRGDLSDRTCDLGLVALDAATAQLRVGNTWGPTVRLSDAAVVLVALADRFLDMRGPGPTAAWHTVELAEPLVEPDDPDPRLPAPTDPLPFGRVPGGHHEQVPPTGLSADEVEALTAETEYLIVTPWRGVLIPEVT